MPTATWILTVLRHEAWDVLQHVLAGAVGEDWLQKLIKKCKRHDLLSKEHPLTVPISQDARFAKAQVMERPGREQEPSAGGLGWDATSLSYFSDHYPRLTEDVLDELMSLLYCRSPQNAGGSTAQCQTRINEALRRHSRITSQPVDLQADCNSLLSDVPWAQTLRHLQFLTFFLSLLAQ